MHKVWGLGSDNLAFLIKALNKVKISCLHLFGGADADFEQGS